MKSEWIIIVVNLLLVIIEIFQIMLKLVISHGARDIGRGRTGMRRQNRVATACGELEEELVARTLWIESSEFKCGEFHEKQGLKTARREVRYEMDTRESCR